MKTFPHKCLNFELEQKLNRYVEHPRIYTGILEELDKQLLLEVGHGWMRNDKRDIYLPFYINDISILIQPAYPWCSLDSKPREAVALWLKE